MRMMITTAAVAGSVLAGVFAPVAASAAPQPQYCLPYQYQYCAQQPYYGYGYGHDRDHDWDGRWHHRGDDDRYGHGRGDRW